MTATGITLLILMALVVAGCLVALRRLQIKMEQRAAELQQRMAQKLQEVASTVRSLEMRIAELSKAPSAVVQPSPVAAPAPVPPVVPAAKKEEPIAPELLVVMAAAITVFLGKTVRIRSAKMLQSPYEIVNPWSQQGRVFVQASHNLRF
jgi:outer membrane murein-binding lipoprotein Lpp